jgi:acylphosphatase
VRTVSGLQRHRVIYAGNVQGVGFRYTARRLAVAAEVSGYVRNLDDGRVELVVEGPPNAVQELLAAIASEMAGYVEEATIEHETPTGVRGFSIRF